jgi:hypothetical protein
LPDDIWVHQILNPFLDLKSLSTVRRCNTFFDEYWQYVLKQNVIRVPEGCSTMNQAMDMAVIFSERNDCTTENQVKILVGEGKHVSVGVDVGSGNGVLMHVSCSNITIVGKGKDKTTILGGLWVNGVQNVKFEQLTVTNPDGIGLCLGATNVDLLKCVVKECGEMGMAVITGATVTATRCEFVGNGIHGLLCNAANTKTILNDSTFHHNGVHGLYAVGDAVVDLHGTKTDIHSNKRFGIAAHTRGKVNIHLPSQHNTTHDNVGEDRGQWMGGSIANINADGTFTHVQVEAGEDGDY